MDNIQNDQNHNQTFSYNYSAKQQEEIQNIRRRYLPAEENKMERLRQLDTSATQKAMMYSLIIGILGALILGIGLCCCLVWEFFILGIIVGVAGIIGVAFAYPLYMYVLKNERAKIAPEIIRLTDELMK